MTHPVFDDCCTPFLRGPTPSGRMVWHHSFVCKVSPNAVIERKPSRAEVVSHAVRRDPDEDYAEQYEAEWSDLAFELEGGR